MLSPAERVNFTASTTSGDLHAQIDVPSDLIPITKIVPLIRSLGDQAQDLEIANTIKAGKSISCQKGCAACCRPMIPVSPPEAFALLETIRDLPQEHKKRIKQNLTETKEHLRKSGLLSTLQHLVDSPNQPPDDEIESLNQAYYALRLPCIFLDNESCSIYNHRPAGCRGHLVTSPPELCQNMENNEIQELHIPLRAGTVMSLIWSDITHEPIRLLPLPIAIEWAESHQNLHTQTWKGTDLMERTIEAMGKFLQHTFASATPKKPRA